MILGNFVLQQQKRFYENMEAHKNKHNFRVLKHCNFRMHSAVYLLSSHAPVVCLYLSYSYMFKFNSPVIVALRIHRIPLETFVA